MSSHAERCPVCHGAGKVKPKGLGEPEKQCHGCGGRGWVTVQDRSRYRLVDPLKKRRPIMLAGRGREIVGKRFRRNT